MELALKILLDKEHVLPTEYDDRRKMNNKLQYLLYNNIGKVGIDNQPLALTRTETINNFIINFVRKIPIDLGIIAMTDLIRAFNSPERDKLLNDSTEFVLFLRENKNFIYEINE